MPVQPASRMVLTGEYTLVTLDAAYASEM
ncbi:hypothetical protein AYX15_07038 [Cryptococcus neoformans]|nr:hypothetical protein AYX15_07038 [Cryptococcus neoformans var. grubii]